VKTATITFVGTRPLLMHNEQLANPLSEVSKKLKILTGKKSKTDADYEEIAEVEFSGGLYFHATDGPYLPDRNIRAALIAAARKQKKGKQFEEGIEYLRERYPLQYDGPRTIAGLFQKKFYDQRMVGNMGKRVLRTRPIFNEWSCEIEVLIDETMIDDRTLEDVVKRAGTLGICDFRPLYGGFVGSVVVGSVVKEKRK